MAAGILRCVRGHLYGKRREQHELEIEVQDVNKTWALVSEYGVPSLAGAAVIGWDLQWSESANSSMLVAGGVLAAFFFQICAQMIERSTTAQTKMPTADQAEMPTDDVEARVYSILVHDVVASASYAILVSSVLCVVLLCISVVGPSWFERTILGVAAGLFVHLFLVLVSLVLRLTKFTAGTTRRSLES